MKKDIFVFDDAKTAIIAGGFIVLGPIIVVALIPIWWLRLLIAIGSVVALAIMAKGNMDDIYQTVESTECANKKVFGDIPMDCKIRRSTANVVETIDDLDFPNSRK